MSEVLSLGGRFYTPVEHTTFAQDAYFMALLQETGVYTAINADSDVVTSIMRSGRVAEFLAAALQPLDRPWSPAFVAETANHFDGLTAPEDKQQLLVLLARVVTGFFVAGGTSSLISPNSSTAPAEQSTSDSPASPVAAASGSTSSKRSRSTRGNRSLVS